MSLHQILLQPTDVLFFRDGRPMSGSLAGHTAAWPLPDVTSHALHAALHRADLEARTGEPLHTHRRGSSGDYSSDDKDRDRKFGSLLTAGPFPVQTRNPKGELMAPPLWFFPRPKDAQLNGSVQVTLRPVGSLSKVGDDDPWLGSSLPDPLEYAVATTQAPDKEAGGEPWISRNAFQAYLADSAPSGQKPAGPSGADFIRDAQIADIEHAIGIGIDSETQTQDKTNFYSAHYLRLRESFRLGLFAEAMDKRKGDSQEKRDLLKLLLNDSPQSIIVGGQQRICTAHRSDAPARLPFPQGLAQATEFQQLADGKFAVKWVLLTPAVWSEIPAEKRDGSPQNPHPGGWLPNWVDPKNGRVLVTSGPGVRKALRKRVSVGGVIGAHLVAAVVPKPIVVTGWAFPNSADPERDPGGGAKPTHLAVPAGAVYYFEADSARDAENLAAALNWHGTTSGTEIKNRRSTLLGEKGYGLGVCGTWQFYPERPAGRP